LAHEELDQIRYGETPEIAEQLGLRQIGRPE
jgi:hypothetical protein